MIQFDMPMPKNCADCCFATADLVNGIITLFCMTPAGRKMYAPDLISRKDRPEWCPIKEQDAVEPIIIDHIVFGTSRKCSKCNQYLFPAGRYCPYCGRSVKWEDD